MRQFVTIALNAFMELVRQPVFLLLATATAFFIIFLASIPYFGFGDDPKMVKDSVLAVMLLCGLLGAVLSASSSIAREIRTGTVLAVLSKPVGRVNFLLAKFAGLALALAFLTYLNLVAALVASRMAYDAYGNTDKIALGLWVLFALLAYGVGGLSNFFLRRPFVSDAFFALVAGSTIAFVAINFFDNKGAVQAFAKGVDWNMAPAGILILFASWIFAGLAVACSTRLDMIPTLAVCSAVFLLGLMSDYLFGGPAAQGSWWASLLYTVTPNWAHFWMADVMEIGGAIPGIWAYVAKAFLYAFCYIGAALSAALWLFEDRELS